MVHSFPWNKLLVESSLWHHLETQFVELQSLSNFNLDGIKLFLLHQLTSLHIFALFYVDLGHNELRMTV